MAGAVCRSVARHRHAVRVPGEIRRARVARGTNVAEVATGAGTSRWLVPRDHAVPIAGVGVAGLWHAVGVWAIVQGGTALTHQAPKARVATRAGAATDEGSRRCAAVVAVTGPARNRQTGRVPVVLGIAHVTLHSGEPSVAIASARAGAAVDLCTHNAGSPITVVLVVMFGRRRSWI